MVPLSSLSEVLRDIGRTRGVVFDGRTRGTVFMGTSFVAFNGVSKATLCRFGLTGASSFVAV